MLSAPARAPAPVRYLPPAPVSLRLTDGTVYALNGGVGAGVKGDYYGGGGTYIAGGARYSGVLSASASRFTFQRPKVTPPKYPHPKPRYPSPKPRYPKGGCGSKGC